MGALKGTVKWVRNDVCDVLGMASIDDVCVCVSVLCNAPGAGPFIYIYLAPRGSWALGLLAGALAEPSGPSMVFLLAPLPR